MNNSLSENNTIGQLIVYGPKIIVRPTFKKHKKSKFITVRLFTVKHSLDNDFVLKIENGSKSGEHGISNGYIAINGKKLVTKSDLKQKFDQIVKHVALKRVNLLVVELRGNPKSFIKLSIEVDPARPLDELSDFLITSYGSVPENIDSHIGLRLYEIPEDILINIQNLIPHNSFIFLGLNPIFPFLSFSPLSVIGISNENVLAKEGLFGLLNELQANGISIEELITALEQSEIHQEGIEAGGVFIQNEAEAVTSIPQGILYDSGLIIHLDINTSHIILRAQEINTLINGNFYDGDDKLTESASTVIHELLHAMFYMTSCFTGSVENEESIISALENLIKAKVDFDIGSPATEQFIVGLGGGDCLNILGLTQPSNNASAWPMFQFDPQHTGRSTDDTAISLPEVPTWIYQVGGMITSSPSIVGDVAYFGSSDGKVHKFDATTGIGEVIYSTGPSLWSAAAISGSTIYIVGASTLGVQTAYLYALNATDGTEAWPPIPLGSGSAGVSSPVVFDGVIYVGNGSGSGPDACPPEGHWLNAISAETGDVLWQAQIIDPNECRKDVLSSPAVTQDTVIVGTGGSCSTCPTVFAFERLTGALKWSALVFAPYIYPAPSIADGIVYVNSGGAGNAGGVIAFDEHTGNELWETSIGSSYGQGSPAIDDGVVFTAFGFSIHALNATTGESIWNVPAGGAGSCATSAFIRYPFFAIADGMVFIKSGNECDVVKVYAINGDTGELLWDTDNLGDNIATGGADTSTPAIANGRLYFGVGNTFYVYGD